MENVQHKQIVEAAGARYRYTCDLGVFFDNSYASTLCLNPADLTVDRVRYEVEKSDRQFAGQDFHPQLAKYFASRK